MTDICKALVPVYRRASLRLDLKLMLFFKVEKAGASSRKLCQLSSDGSTTGYPRVVLVMVGSVMANKARI